MKCFNVQERIGNCRYVVNHHDGYSMHRDGSPFYDCAIFSNKRKLAAFTKGLLKAGYKDGDKERYCDNRACSQSPNPGTAV